jgi:ribonuclease HI
MEQSTKTAEEHSALIKSDLCASGFVANNGKSTWVPTQHITWLGLDWNGEIGTVAIAAHCIEKLKSAAIAIQNQHKTTARQLASVVGQIISTGPVTGNLARIMSRHCQLSVAYAENWDTAITIDDYCRHELQFWLTHLDLVNARSFTELACSNRTICSDASVTACGAIILGTDHMAHRMLTNAERETSSTYRELLAIQLAVQAFEPLLTDCKVKLLTDSQAAMKIAQVGSMKLEYHALAISIFSKCFRARIQLDLQWIPQTFNEQADTLASCMISMTGKSSPPFLNKLTLSLVSTHWIALQTPGTQNFPDTFPGFGIRKRPEWTRFTRIGQARLRGCPTCLNCAAGSVVHVPE